MRFSAFFLSGITALSGCSSSDNGTKGGAGGAPVDAGHEAASVVIACKSPKDVLSAVDQQPTGFVSCANGRYPPIHRAQVKDCASGLPRTLQCIGFGSGTDSGQQLGYCKSDSDCKAKPEGYCQTTQRNATCSCYYGCKTDSDCPANNLCECGNPTGTCVAEQCKSDADCGAGKLCLSANDGDCGTVFACQSPDDQCAGDLDCTKFPGYSQCTFTGTHRECKQPRNCGI